MKENTHTEEGKHTVPGVIAGFVFQFYYFLYELLIIKPGETVSFEKLDDTASELEDGQITLYQVKHTVKNVGVPKDSSVMLTNRATELWKTLDLWRKLIVGESSNNRSEEEQLEYIKTHKFVLVVNKDVDGNKLFELCDAIRKSKADLKKVIEVLNEISLKERPSKSNNQTESDTKPKKRNVQSMIEDLRDFEFVIEFLGKVEFKVTSIDDIKVKCHDHLRGYMNYSLADVSKVFNDFYTELSLDFDTEIAKGNHIEYKHTEKLERFERVFQLHRQDSLDFRIDMKPFDSDFTKLVCIRQLEKVGDIQLSSIDKIARYTSHFLSFKNRYLELKDESRILESEDNNFREDAIAFYKNEFDYAYDELGDSTNDDEINKKAKELLYKIRANKLSLRNEQLGIPISNGAYYYLSDERLIGWHPEWETLFNKE